MPMLTGAKLYDLGPDGAAQFREAACWVHLRRDFHDVWTATGSEIARVALNRIGAHLLILAPFHLRRGRYAPSAQRVCLCCVAHFAHWLTGERCGLSAINEAAVARFLSEHLTASNCPYPARRLRHALRAALAQLLDVLRSDGVGAPHPASDTAVAQELARFD